jgi:hypothetical protein
MENGSYSYKDYISLSKSPPMTTTKNMRERERKNTIETLSI